MISGFAVFWIAFAAGLPVGAFGVLMWQAIYRLDKATPPLLAARAPRQKSNIYQCPRCKGNPRKACERCGGIGYLKRCDRLDCHEYGCGGEGHCLPTATEIAKFKMSVKGPDDA